MPRQLATPVRVLLANDDGVASKGLAAARDALMAAGVTVLTVAPHQPRSGTARSASFRRPVSLERHGGSDAHPIYASDGTPTDCVRVAILSGVADRIDAVVSGINEGANLGDDATYSSTLGAAIEGALLGFPAISASQQTRDGRFRLIDLTDYDFEPGARLLARLVERLISGRAGLPPRSVLNVNFPGNPAKGIRVAHFDERQWGPGSIFSEPRASDGAAGWLVFGTHPVHDPVFSHQRGSDSWTLAQGYAAVTPLNFKWSDATGRRRLARWTRAVVGDLNRDLYGE